MIKAITVNAFEANASTLIQEHWQETEPYWLATPIPQYDFYRTLEATNSLILFGAFQEVMVGYIAAFVYIQPHYGMLFAQHDVLFLTKEKRNSMLAGRLMLNAEHEAKARGAKHFYWHAKLHGEMNQLLKSRYPLEEMVYRKEL